MQTLKSKQIWQLQLQAVEVGKDVVGIKEKKTSTAHLEKMRDIELAKARVKQGKKQRAIEKQYMPMKSLRNGETPATQKQINAIGYMLKDSKKVYDYYYPRDKYTLSMKVASAFIVAIETQQDFSFNRGTRTKQKMIKAYYEGKLDATLGDNHDMITTT